MAVIILNAIVLAVETGESSDNYVDLFEILDNFFLSVYLVGWLIDILPIILSLLSASNLMTLS